MPVLYSKQGSWLCAYLVLCCCHWGGGGGGGDCGISLMGDLDQSKVAHNEVFFFGLQRPVFSLWQPIVGGGLARGWWFWPVVAHV